MYRIGAILAVCLLVWAIPSSVSAHGVTIVYATATTVTVNASFDSGEPMAGAQVNVFAPDDPRTPWLQGTCDEQGRFTFEPDPALSGDWEVQVRLAGHGDVIVIPVNGTNGIAAAVNSQPGYTPLQIVTMSATVVWGFIGTALYFTNRKR
jgi:nickel transport protein